MVLICTWSAGKFLLVSRKADTCTTARMPGITGLSIVTEYHYKGQPMKSFTSLISLHIPPQCCSKCWYQPPVPAFVSAGWSDGQLAAVPCAAAALVQLTATVSHDQPHPTWTVFPFGIGKAKIRRFQEKSLLSWHKKKIDKTKFRKRQRKNKAILPVIETSLRRYILMRRIWRASPATMGSIRTVVYHATERKPCCITTKSPCQWFSQHRTTQRRRRRKASPLITRSLTFLMIKWTQKCSVWLVSHA